MKRKTAIQFILPLLVCALLTACGGGRTTTPTQPPESAATSTPSADEHFEQGLAYYDEGRYEEAIAEFLEVVRLDPDNVNAHYNLGLAYQKTGDLNSAMDKYLQVIRLDPSHTAARNNLAVIYEDQGQIDKAIAEYQEVIRIDPEDEVAHYNLALLYDTLGQIDQAVAEYQETIRINPDNADAHYNLGITYYDQGQPDRAIAEWQEAARIQPDDSMTHNNLGRAYFDQGRLEEAEAELTEALRLDPTNEKAHFNLALVYTERGQEQEAIAEFEAFLQYADPDDPARPVVEQHLASLEGEAGEMEYWNDEGDYGLLYPSGLLYDESGSWVVFSTSEAAVDAAFESAYGEAISSAPVVTFDGKPLDALIEDFGLEETAEPADFVQVITDWMGAEILNLEEGTLNDYPAAVADVTGSFDEVPFLGYVLFVSTGDQGVIAVGMATPEQWDTFEPIAWDMATSLRFGP